MSPRRTAASAEYFRPSEAGPPQDYKGVEVTEVGIRVRNLGDGLSESTAIAPMEMPIGSKVMGIFYATVESHEYDPTKDSDEDDPSFKLSMVLKADGAFFPDPDLIAKAVTVHQERVRQHRDEMKRQAEEAKGINQIPGTERKEGEGNVTPSKAKADPE